MKKLKHNKIKNTGLIFEILTRKFTSETLDGKRPVGIAIIKKHYNPKSELVKELKLYEALSKKRPNFTDDFIDTCLTLRERIDEEKLKDEKYKLIKSIKKMYDLNEFFNTRVGDYKLQASIYKLFEYKKEDNPEQFFDTKSLVVECLKGQEIEYTKKEYEDLLQNDRNTLRLGMKYIVEKFTDKYRDLNLRQKNLLQEFIQKDQNSKEFKEFIFNEARDLDKRLSKLEFKVKDTTTRIKLKECRNLLEEITKSKAVKNEHLDALLQYYALEDVLGE